MLSDPNLFKDALREKTIWETKKRLSSFVTIGETPSIVSTPGIPGTVQKSQRIIPPKSLTFTPFQTEEWDRSNRLSQLFAHAIWKVIYRIRASKRLKTDFTKDATSQPEKEKWIKPTLVFPSSFTTTDAPLSINKSEKEIPTRVQIPQKTIKSIYSTFEKPIPEELSYTPIIQKSFEIPFSISIPWTKVSHKDSKKMNFEHLLTENPLFTATKLIEPSFIMSSPIKSSHSTFSVPKSRDTLPFSDLSSRKYLPPTLDKIAMETELVCRDMNSTMLT